MRIPLFLLFLLCSGHLSAEVYKWVDQDGVHYGDKPSNADAQPIKLPEVSGYQPRQLPTQETQKAAATGGQQAPQGVYRQLEILSPANNGTVRANDGVVPVQLAIDPPLQEGHVLSLILDGIPVAEGISTGGGRLTGVERGTHNLQAVISDEQGRQLISSARVEFFVHKTSLLQKPRLEEPNGSPRIRQAPQAPRAPVYAPRSNP